MSDAITIRVCMGTGGIASGGTEVLAAFETAVREAGIPAEIKEHCASHKVGCRGLCSQDVLVDIIVNEARTTYRYIKPHMVPRLVEEHIVGGVPVGEWMVGEDYVNFNGKQEKVVLADCGVVNPESIDSYLHLGGYRATRKVLDEMSPEHVIEEMKKSGLRGRGGAGFPTGVKWEAARKAAGEPKYIICNSDEGDPGAFMDRALLEGNPHAVIEGMIIAAYAVGATKGYAYVRAEYPLAVERLDLAIREARTHGYLGEDIRGTGFSFDIAIKLGAGAFVCGEETALIASLEGQRGMPRAKPPFPVHRGLWGKPTVINNVETLANIPYIMVRGAEWYAAYGTEKSRGTKVFALTGKVRNTGLIEVPMGITLREIVYEIGNGIENDKAFKAVQTGGPSGGCIPASMLDLAVDYESLARVGSIVGSGGMIVLDEESCMVGIAKYFLSFTQIESCGKCVPCRIGTKRLLEILERITKGEGKEEDMETLERLSTDIKAGSLCGLGQSAPNPVLSTLKYFREEYEAHIRDKKCPAKACKDLLTYTIIAEACTGCGACKRACAVGAITGEKKQPHVLNQALCIKCGGCFDVCRFKAVGRE
jgi:NADH-quinone oxidoreductase subunit F